VIEGVCLHWQQTERFAYGRVRDAQGRRYSVAGNQVEQDAVGRYELIPGEVVRFDRGPDRMSKSGKKRRTAVNVRRPFKDESTDYRTHREVCKVLDENWLLRLRGGLLAVSLGDLDGIRPGSIVECGVEPSDGFKTWRANDVVFLFRSEEEWAASEVEV
jgi:hypothetical protein